MYTMPLSENTITVAFHSRQSVFIEVKRLVLALISIYNAGTKGYCERLAATPRNFANLNVAPYYLNGYTSNSYPEAVVNGS